MSDEPEAAFPMECPELSDYHVHGSDVLGNRFARDYCGFAFV
jgi:hypothetical protein